MAENNNELRKLIREILVETFDEFTNPYHIVVLIDKNDISNFGQINEGIWKPAIEKGYVQRIDQPHFDWQLQHIHIAKDKHVNSKDKQVSWNDDGTRHDKKSFNDNFIGMEKAKQIARSALNLSDDIQLENFNTTDKVDLILENVDNLPTKSSIYIFKVVTSSNSNPILLFS
jgi:hypothetical protein